MKQLSIILLASIVTLFGCSDDAEKKSVTTELATANTTANIEIEGMVCQHGCAGLLEKSLSSIVGIESCSVNFESKLAVVNYNNNTVSDEKIKSVVTSLSDGQFTIIKFETLPMEGGNSELETSGKNGIDIKANSSSFEVPNFIDIFKGIL